VPPIAAIVSRIPAAVPPASWVPLLGSKLGLKKLRRAVAMMRRPNVTERYCAGMIRSPRPKIAPSARLLVLKKKASTPREPLSDSHIRGHQQG
jgi:hypothetical protein